VEYTPRRPRAGAPADRQRSDVRSIFGSSIELEIKPFKLIYRDIMAHPSFYKTTTVDFVQGLIDKVLSGNMAPKTALKDILEHLSEHNIVLQQKLTVEQVMVHPANRGGLGLNAYNAHANGEKILDIGVDEEELEKAMAFQRMPLEPLRSEQLAFNQRLVDSSKGMLSPLTGKEEVCSVGTGHTAAFFKAINAGCATPQTKLQDAAGRLSKEALCNRDKRLQTALTSGWTWQVLPWQCQIQWPRLPDLAQRALNASQNVASLMSELEVVVTIAELDATRTDASDFNDCVTAVARNNPPCKAISW
jgi:hypothetical protein